MRKASTRRSKKPKENGDGLWRKFVDFITDAYFSFLPSEDILELPTSYMYLVGIVVYIGALGLFVYFVYEGVANNIGQKFLSLQSSAGTCNAISKPLSGSFKADTLGRWEGSENFEYSLAKYQFVANLLKTSDIKWAEIIYYIKDSVIYPISLLMKQSDLAFNMLVWTVWSVSVVESGHVQSFSLTGAPEVLFYRENYVGSVGSIKGDCPLTPITTFNANSYFFGIQYDAQQYKNNSICMHALSPETIGNSPKSTFMDVTYDSRAFLVAAGVNAGLIDISSLVSLDGYSSAPFQIGEITVQTEVVYDPRWPGMYPIGCIVNVALNKGLACFMIISSTIQAVPLFNHHGSGTELEPALCDCLDGTGYSDQCNAFNFLTGFLLFEGDSLFDISKLLAFVASYDFNIPLINKLAFKAMYAMVSQDVIGNTFQNNTYRHEAYDFCFGNCSIVTINAYDEFYQVSKYYYSVNNGSCTDTITSDSFDLLVIPFTSLTEVYFECVNSLYNTIINSMGIASGNFQLFLPPFIGLCLIIAKIFMKYFGVAERPYGQGERDDILNSFALQLLLYRDKKMGNSDNLDPYSTVLSSIITECKINVLESDGFIDNMATLNGVHNLRDSLGLPPAKDAIYNSICKPAETVENVEDKYKPTGKIYPIQVAVKPKEPSNTLTNTSTNIISSAIPTDLNNANINNNIEMIQKTIPISILSKEIVPINYKCIGGNCKDTFTIYLISSGNMVSLIFPTISFIVNMNSNNSSVKSNDSILIHATSNNFPNKYVPNVQINQLVTMSINNKIEFVNIILKNSNELYIQCISTDSGIVTMNNNNNNHDNNSQHTCVLIGCQLVYAVISV